MALSLKMMEISMRDKYELVYSKRTIGVAHYPMASTFLESKNITELNFLNSFCHDTDSNAMLLYCHIPFCSSICSFCPYNKIQFQADKITKYLAALLVEIDLYSKTKYIASKNIEAIYFGGGTPSVLNILQLENLIKTIKAKFNLTNDVEITVEGNAASFSTEKLIKLRELGVDRISLGVQTFNKEICKILEVPHSPIMTTEVIRKARQIGFRNIAIDLMYNLPKQTTKIWQEDLMRAVSLKIDNITLFPLVVVPTTKLWQQVKKSELIVRDIHNELSMFDYAIDFLQNNGYLQVSTYDFVHGNNVHNYAEKHFKYGYELLGMGVSAFGEINNTTYINVGEVDKYINLIKSGKLPIHMKDKVAEKEKIHALMAMGLRYLEVDFNKFESIQRKTILQKFDLLFNTLQTKNLINISDGKISLTRKGKLWGNNICKEFYSDEYKKTLPAWERVEALAKIQPGNIQEEY